MQTHADDRNESLWAHLLEWPSVQTYVLICICKYKTEDLPYKTFQEFTFFEIVLSRLTHCLLRTDCVI